MKTQDQIKLDIGKYNYYLWDGSTTCTPSQNERYSDLQRPKMDIVTVPCPKLYVLLNLTHNSILNKVLPSFEKFYQV